MDTVLLFCCLFFASLALVLALALWLSYKREINLCEELNNLDFEFERLEAEIEYIREKINE